ncbi:hypothetical protein [Cecembia lonarensis]|uniref:Uncharacterized protein n=1 Tax=Cecembia lonarensis (strain CCUG 58316 / KCTC 22772 / LW9) TaxID=1225176 RepID=K1KUW5_CECL9|nr:hypothetical protein [Cecembia lonarensis]EKB47980.1 hypothetical protein B879_03408 [Cecembia lonarensis LW9]
MTQNKKLDLVFLSQSKSFFARFHQQSGIVEEIFLEVANAFPQSKLKRSFDQAKGCKISKGNQLQGLPYQVLDLVRDFSHEKGFNIRFLHWWGFGLYLFLTYGKQTKKEFSSVWVKNFPDFNVNAAISPFAYPEIIKSPIGFEQLSIDDVLFSPDQLQLWKKIQLNEAPEVTAADLIKITEDILYYHAH